MADHAILSPSAASRWLVCTPSARFEQQEPESRSDYSNEGDVAHDCAAAELIDVATMAMRSVEYGSECIKPDAYTSDFYCPEMQGHAEDYAQYCLTKPGRVLVEFKFSLEPFIPCGFGRTDCTVYAPGRLTVIDFKYGQGVRVGAKDNPQLKIYAVGAIGYLLKQGIKFLNTDTVEICIFQPRIGMPSEWQTTVGELLEWARDVVAPKAQIAITGRGDFIAGRHCQFCEARLRCKAWYDRFAVLASLIDKRKMTDAEVAEVLRDGDALKTWINKVQADAVVRLARKEQIPGFKLVEGKGRRAFVSEDRVVDTLIGLGWSGEDIYTQSLKPLTEIEKKMKPKVFASVFADLIYNDTGKPVIADDMDPRPAYGTTGADAYDAED